MEIMVVAAATSTATTSTCPRHQRRTSDKPEAQKKPESHLPAERAESGGSSANIFIALHRCHGYWSITTVSWELNKHMKSCLMQKQINK